MKYIEHPLLQKNKVEARLYQQKLAADVLKDGNSMIVAPTALGKTIIAALVSIEQIRKHPKTKVLLLSPSKPLTIQHEETLNNITTLPTTILTGAIKPEERVKRWETSQLICATPQTIESDLLNKRYDLEKVSLIVFDECHHAIGSYAYVYLANRYVQEASEKLILGLTASPGSQEEKIEKVCSNLYITNVMIKSEDDADVKPYFNPIEIEWEKIKLNPEMITIQTHLNKALKNRLKMLKNLKIIKSISVGKKDILRARGKVQNRIGRSITPPKECYRAMSIITAVINVQHALELLETQGIAPLNQYLKRLDKKTTKASKNLKLDPDFAQAMYLTKLNARKGVEHPKIKKLIKILKTELTSRDNKIIIFTQYRDTIDLIDEHCQKEKIKSLQFYGQGSQSGKKGLTQKEQKKRIKSFKEGDYQVLISTSVAEEGIDIPAVDLVILYEPVPSDIRMIQRRGRTGRKNKGRMKVLITEKTRDEAYYWASKHKETQMKAQLNSSNIKKIGKTKPAQKTITDLQYINTKNTVSKTKKEKEKVENKVNIFVDSRERNSQVLKNLEKLETNITISTMTVADYQVSEEVAIERKTAKDFIESIIDKRLYKQATSMREEFKKPLLILEGDDIYSGFIQPNAIRGAIASLALDFQISIIPTRGPEDTAAMIYRIAKREQKDGPTPISIRTEKKPVTLTEQQLFIIESLPHVGPIYAKNLLKHFHTVENILNADEKELMKVEGIGKKTAHDIKKVLKTEYQSFTKDKNTKLEDHQ